jgi:3-oxo-5-alpha-steroid 4-dehydrogenase 3
VGPIYLLLTAAALLSIVSPALRSLSSHGKTRFASNNKCHYNKKVGSHGCSLHHRVWDFLLNNNALTVSKCRFTDFYAIGIITTIINFIMHIKILGTIAHTYWLPTYVLMIHLIRRLCECLWVQTSVSTSRMHVSGYLLGIVHYLCLPFVFILPLHQQLIEESYNNRVKSVTIGMSLVGCLYFQYQQHRHHVTLGRLRPKDTSGGIHSYRIPKGDWFEFVSCPHYFSEIMVYLMFAILIQTQVEVNQDGEDDIILSLICIHKHWIVLLWVATNLAISAERTHAWYTSTFGEAYPQREKLIPYLW